jgi:hypothetical protein
MTLPTENKRNGWTRSCFRFSLRFLFIALTIFCVWLAVRVRQAKHDKIARQAVAPFARVIHYDFQFDAEGKFLPAAKLGYGKWLRETLGDEFFCRMHTVMFSDDVTDSDLLAIRDALEGTSLQSISLAPCRSVTDNGLAFVSDLDQLLELDLRETSVTNEGLKNLSGLRNLRELQLGSTHPDASSCVDDEGLKVLESLPQLRSLFLCGERFTDSGLSHLQAVPELRVFWLQSTRVSRDVLGTVKHLTHLEVLSVQGCDLEDADLSDLLTMPQLKELYINSIHVTDASIEILSQLQHLEDLSLRGTGITSEGIAKLRIRLPNCTVW